MLALEITGGLFTNSLALLADAGHVLGDAGALLLALGAIWLAGRRADSRRTFGWYRAEILAALINGVALLVIAGAISARAAGRLGDDPEVNGGALLTIAAIGLLGNLAGVRLLYARQRDDLNIRGAYYHLVGDALGSVGALVAGAVILATGWVTIDLIASLAVAALLLLSGARLIRASLNVLLEAAPTGIDVNEIAADLCGIPGVLGVHDLHIWTVTSGFPAVSCHVEIAEESDAERVIVPAAQRLQERFGLRHVTLQPETAAVHEAIQCCEFPDQARTAPLSVGHHHEPAESSRA